MPLTNSYDVGTRIRQLQRNAGVGVPDVGARSWPVSKE